VCVDFRPPYSSYGYSLMRYTVMTSANSTSILKACAIWRDARWAYALRNWGVYTTAAFVRLKALAPYALIELILPGGSVMALLLWLYRRRKSGVGFGQSSVRLLSFLRLAEPLRAILLRLCSTADTRPILRSMS
jgi:hypothetical protein